ncbi:MAG: hypothetical protein JNM76_08635 [Betaproteobacteria bacterium]|nr:hypothetical protein [Betaproteobacteria bacterium]
MAQQTITLATSPEVVFLSVALVVISHFLLNGIPSFFSSLDDRASRLQVRWDDDEFDSATLAAFRAWADNDARLFVAFRDLLLMRFLVLTGIAPISFIAIAVVNKQHDFVYALIIFMMTLAIKTIRERTDNRLKAFGV